VPLPDASRLDRNPGPALARRFRQLGLTREYLRSMTGRGDDLLSPLTPTRAAEFTPGPAAAALLLFFCGRPVLAETAAEAVGPDLLDQLLACGLLIPAGPSRLTAPFHLRIVQGLYLFSDYLGGDSEAVMGAGETTAVLFRAGCPAGRVDRALDLGCGAGTIALLLAGRAHQVVGTDINPRAIALARLNASVNRLENVAFRMGDVFDPVAGELFDLILAQPPYYPNPSGAGQVFLHGGARGDEISRRVVDGLPRHLAPGGRAVLFTSWPEDAPRAWPEVLRVVEFTTGRQERHGTRQSLDIIEHAGPGGAWSAAYQVAADRWGLLDSRRVSAVIASEALARGPREALLGARLRLPAGAGTFREDSQLFLRSPSDPLAGFVPIDEATWEVLAAVDRAPDTRSAIATFPSSMDALRVVERALHSGFLVPAG